MRQLIRLGFLSLALGATFTACSPERVGPRENGMDSPSIAMAGENEHFAMNPVCSDTIVLPLQGPDNGYNVNYQCTVNCPSWGTVAIVNGKDSLAAYVTLAPTWFLDVQSSAFTLESNFQFGTDGRPLTTNDFLSQDVNQYNRFSIFVDKANINKDANGCFAAAVRLTVVKLSFFGGIDNASRRVVWATNPEYNVSGSPYASSSPYLTTWCWKECAPPTPGGDYGDSCVALAEIPSYTCSTTGGGNGGNGGNNNCGPGNGNGYGNGYGGNNGYGNNNSNNISSTTTRCVTTSGNLGTVTFTGNGGGKLVIESGVTTTASLSANNGGTVIVKGTLNLNGSSTYNDNLDIYVAEGGTLNRTGNLSFTDASASLTNYGTVNITGALTSEGVVGNAGILNAGSMSLVSGGRLYNQGTVLLSQSLSATCSSSGGGYNGGGNNGGCNNNGGYGNNNGYGGNNGWGGNNNNNGYGGNNNGYGGNNGWGGNNNNNGYGGNNGGGCNGNNNWGGNNGCNHNGGGHNNCGHSGGGWCNNGPGGNSSCNTLVHNCGRIDAGTTITVGQGATFFNYCTVVARNAFTLTGTLNNSAIVVGGTTGVTGGFTNNGTINAGPWSVIVSNRFVWGSNRTINLNGDTWIIASTSTIGGTGSIQTLGTSGILSIGTGAAVSGAGEMELVDADPFGVGDLPTGVGAALDILTSNGATYVGRRSYPETDVPFACNN